MAEPLRISFRLDKKSIRKLSFDTPVPHRIYHLYPSLVAYRARTIPDKNNPRGHESDRLLRSGISKEIRRTLEGEPQTFKLRNKGGLVIAHQFHYDDSNGIATIELTDYETQMHENGEETRPLHGLADGGTTDRIISEMQKDDRWTKNLQEAQWHLEVVVFDDDSDDSSKRDVLSQISWARNTSQQVKLWSLHELKGDWNWLKKALDNRFPLNTIAYDENAEGEVTVLDVLAILNLFHPYFTGNKAPTSSYASKQSMMPAFENRRDGFKRLSPVLIDILDLHDHIYAGFNLAHQEDGRNKSLRRFIDSLKGGRTFKDFDPPKKLPFSNREAEIEIDRPFLYPILAAFRALLDFPEDDSGVSWSYEPTSFWDKHGHDLVTRLLDSFIQHKKNPNATGKDPNLYRNLYDTVYSIRRDEELARLRKQLTSG